jgi:hypothetical protein
MKKLREIVELFENKVLANYRFDKGAKKDICKNCEYFKDNYCLILKDKVNSKYTCDKLKRTHE